MDPQEIRQALRRQPFVPFRLHLLDGTRFDIKHPDGLLLLRRVAHVAASSESPGAPQGTADADDETLPERAVVITLLHISRMEELPAASVSGNGATS
jgi:hypothetical protein